jgi:outer membrane protein assembly factor BamD
MNRSFYILFAVLALLSACSDSPEEAETKMAEVESITPVEDLYNEALDSLNAENWKQAKTQFEEVERQHPYSSWAKKAQMLNAYAAYKNQDYEETIAILDRYAQLYPGDEQIDYAYYLIALSYYEQITDVGRDQSMTQDALIALNEVIRRFPKSDYARDAALKKDLTIDHLAGKEMNVGRYYISRKEYLAALKRFQKVVKDFQGTTHVPEALHRIVELYLKIGIVSEAKNYAAVLGHNYPANQWYRDSYKLLAGEGLAEPLDGESVKEDEGWF